MTEGESEMTPLFFSGINLEDLPNV
jgi:hypothetical protein